MSKGIWEENGTRLHITEMHRKKRRGLRTAVEYNKYPKTTEYRSTIKQENIK